MTGAHPHGSPTGVAESSHPKDSAAGSPVEQWNGVNGVVPGSLATTTTTGDARQLQQPPEWLVSPLGDAVSQPVRSSAQQDQAAAAGDGNLKDLAGPNASAGVLPNVAAGSSQESRQDHVSRFATNASKTQWTYLVYDTNDIIVLHQLGVHEGVLYGIKMRYGKHVDKELSLATSL